MNNKTKDNRCSWGVLTNRNNEIKELEQKCNTLSEFIQYQFYLNTKNTYLIKLNKKNPKRSKTILLLLLRKRKRMMTRLKQSYEQMQRLIVFDK